MAFSSKISFEEFLSLKSALQRGESLTFIIGSNSMEPVVKTGERVKVEPIISELRTFDLIVFFQNGLLVSHMFIKKSQIDEKIITASYKYKSYDFPVGSKELLGRITSHKLSFFQKLKLILKKS